MGGAGGGGAGLTLRGASGRLAARDGAVARAGQPRDGATARAPVSRRPGRAWPGGSRGDEPVAAGQGDLKRWHGRCRWRQLGEMGKHPSDIPRSQIHVVAAAQSHCSPRPGSNRALSRPAPRARVRSGSSHRPPPQQNTSARCCDERSGCFEEVAEVGHVGFDGGDLGGVGWGVAGSGVSLVAGAAEAVGEGLGWAGAAAVGAFDEEVVGCWCLVGCVGWVGGVGSCR